MILAVQENLVPGHDIATQLDAALTAGFDGLELRDAARGGLEPVRGRAPTACPALNGWLGDFDAAAREYREEHVPRQHEP